MLPVVAIVGRPNVGKSTLFNRLCGERRALVHDSPGVTRDRFYGTAELGDREVVLVDTGGFEPQPEDDLSRIALHNFVLAILGIQVLDRADFQSLAEAAAERRRWEFMVTIAPLPIPNGTGSPVNPIAMF